MCLIAFAIGVSPDWPLVIASNRDEFLSRPTLPLARWMTDSGQPIISGRDLLAGGTWLGLTPGGRAAFLTNVRAARPEAAPQSRGELVTRWLEAKSDAESFVTHLKQQDPLTYGGFNLVLGDIRRGAWHWVTNKSGAGAPAWQVQSLKPGIFGLSNAALDTPWPKTARLKSVLQAALAANAKVANLDMVRARLWKALANRELAAEKDLPATGVSRQAEKALSSAFVEFPEQTYGTRSSTVLTIDSGTLGGSLPFLKTQIGERTHLRDSLDLVPVVQSTGYTQVDLAFCLDEIDF